MCIPHHQGLHLRIPPQTCFECLKFVLKAVGSAWPNQVTECWGVLKVTPTPTSSLAHSTLPDLPLCKQLWPHVPTAMPSLPAGPSETEYLSCKLVLSGTLVTVMPASAGVQVFS